MRTKTSDSVIRTRIRKPHISHILVVIPRVGLKGQSHEIFRVIL
jgi:hypothetical protein